MNRPTESPILNSVSELSRDLDTLTKIGINGRRKTAYFSIRNLVLAALDCVFPRLFCICHHSFTWPRQPAR